MVSWGPTRLSMEALLEDISRRDDLGIILRGHLYVEHALGEMLAIMLPNATGLKKLRLTFQRKVDLARALGLLLRDEDGPLIALNELRNNYAHNLSATVSQAHVTQLYSSMKTRWWKRLGKGGLSDVVRPSLQTYVMALAVGLDAKLERVKELRSDVLRLHKKVLRAYAADLSGEGPS